MKTRLPSIRKTPLYVAILGIGLAIAGICWLLAGAITEKTRESQILRFEEECASRWPSREVTVEVVENTLNYTMFCLVKSSNEFVPEENIRVN